MKRTLSKTTRVRARVPASIANIGSGFDVHSIALETPELSVEFSMAARDLRAIQVRGQYAN